MKIEILPATPPTALAILSMSGLDNRELNPAIEKQLTNQGILAAQPQSALADLLLVIHHRHAVQMQAWDMTALNTDQVQLQVGRDHCVTLQRSANEPLAPNLDGKSSRVLVIIGGPRGTEEMVHATGQELQRKIKAFFGIQARLQFRTCLPATQVLETAKPDPSV